MCSALLPVLIATCPPPQFVNPNWYVDDTICRAGHVLKQRFRITIALFHVPYATFRRSPSRRGWTIRKGCILFLLSWVYSNWIKGTRNLLPYCNRLTATIRHWIPHHSARVLWSWTESFITVVERHLLSWLFSAFCMLLALLSIICLSTAGMQHRSAMGIAISSSNTLTAVTFFFSIVSPPSAWQQLCLRQLNSRGSPRCPEITLIWFNEEKINRHVFSNNQIYQTRYGATALHLLYGSINQYRRETRKIDFLFSRED